MRIQVDASSGRRPTAPKRSPLAILGHAADTAGDYALCGGIAALVLALAYVVYGVMHAPAGDLRTLPAAEHARILSNFQLGLRVLLWGWALVVISVAHRLYRGESTGYVLALIGVASYWGVPLAVAVLLPGRGDELMQLLVAAGQRGGLFCLIPGGIIMVYDLLGRVRGILSGGIRFGTVSLPKGHSIELQPGMLPLQCWMTNYCRPYVRDICPRHTGHTACWRVKEGCFCEEKILLRAFELKEGSSSFYKQMHNILGVGGGVTNLTAAEKRQRCRRCPIYAEHQRFKYRLAVPFAFLAAVWIICWGRPLVFKFLDSSLGRIDALVARLSFAVTQGSAAAAPSHLTAFQDAYTMAAVNWGVLTFLGILVLTWLLHLVEWLLLKVQV